MTKIHKEQLVELPTSETSICNHQTEKCQSYLDSRLKELSITPEENTFITTFSCFDDYTEKQISVFSSDENDNIKISYVGLNGLKTFLKYGKKEVPYTRTRLNPNLVKNGKMKYKTEFGAKSEIFFPPKVIESFHKKKTVNTLFITEGEFKAFKASIHEISCIGIQGIHNHTERDEHDNKVLNTEIELFIKTCKVKNVVLLFDNDCLKIEYEEDKDLFKRPNNFYSAIKNFRENIKHLEVDVYFSHLNTELSTKGLDDLLVSKKDEEHLIYQAIHSLKKSTYFEFFNISDSSLLKLKSYFNISNVSTFYENYQDIIQDKVFRFNGWYYQHTGETVKPLVNDEVKKWCRIGDYYYKLVHKPNKENSSDKELLRRNKETLIDDFGKLALKFIPRYEDFINVPSHLNYKESINGFLNKYQPLNHEPQKGGCNHILRFLKHLFGESHYEFILDYIKLLYERPEILLPIILLESKERGTGKSTFGQLLIYIFGNNSIKIGNSDLESNFNAVWIEKLLIVIDETSLDKKGIEQLLRRLSTETGKTIVNEKNKAQYSTYFFGKFIFFSNEEGKALTISKGEDRYAVFRAPVISNEVIDTDLDKKMQEEIPAFLNFLTERPLFYPQKGRMYFDFEVYKTPYLEAYFDNSKPYIAKIISNYMEECFEVLAQQDTLKFAVKDLHRILKESHRNVDEISIKNTLKDYFGLKPEINQRYTCFNLHLYQDENAQEIYEQRKVGRPFIFNRNQFTNIPA